MHATARSDIALTELQKMGAHGIMLDVTEPDSVADIVRHLNGKLDLVVYVAGVFGADSGADVPPSTLQFDQVMHANVLGAMQLIPLVLPMVEAAGGKFIFITSGMGSIADAQGSMGWVYRTSKAALNMAVHTASFDYPKATLIAMNLGWVKTDMGGPGAPTSAIDSVAGMLRVVAATTQKDSGSFLSHDRKKWPW